MARSVTFVIEGDVDTFVTIEEGDFDGDGITDLKFTLEVDDSEGMTADLRGLFLDVADDDVDGWSVDEDDSPDVTDSRFDTDNVDDLGNGANMRGHITNKGRKFDAGVEIGRQGLRGGEDDINETSFVLTGDGEPITLDDIAGERIGLRLTSVGEIDGDREDSLKLEAIIPNPPDAVDDADEGEEDTVITGNVLDNDTDEDLDPLTVVEVNGESADVGVPVTLDNGVLTLNADGSYEFVPTTSFVGTQTFEYSISDGNGGFDWAEVTIDVTLVPGITVDLEDVETDLLLAQDLSGSFSDDLANLQSPSTFFSDLDAALDPDDDGTTQFGIASFIDYPFSPFGSASDFIYSTDQAVTDDDTAVQTALDGLATGDGGDFEEAQLVALLQAAVGSAAGFRAGAEKFIVLSTDAAFHVAGDYLAGGPNDGDDDLADGAGPNGEEDYPSVEQIADALFTSGVRPIFAVTAGLVGTYEALLADLNAFHPSIDGVVVEISDDSSDLADAILDALGEDILGTDGRDTLSGNNQRNTIDGGARADVIDGEGGDDVLIGGTGNDTLTGGDGADVFVLENAVMFRGTDSITDFEDGIDTIALSGYGAVGFGDLTIADDGFGNAEIFVNDGNVDDPIAIVEGTAAGDLGVTDFDFV